MTKHISLPRIISGQLKNLTGANQDIFEERHKICKACPNIKELPVIGEVCGVCGCQLSAKLRVKQEVCPVNNWGSLE